MTMASLRRQLWVLVVVVGCGPTAPGAETTATQTATSTGDSPPTTGPVPTSTGTGDTGGSSGTSEGAADTGGSSTTGGTTGGGGSTTGSATTGDSTTGDSTGGSTTGSTGEPVGEPAICQNTFFEQGCPPVDCEKASCGGLFDVVDEFGEVRKACTPQTCSCDPGFTCFEPSSWGGCVTTNKFCNGQTEDCGGAYCVPDTVEPPPFACGGTDQTSCEAAGCTFVMAPWIDGEQNCQCGEAFPTCLWFPQPADSVPTVTAYYHGFNPADVRLFPAKWSTPPWPWKLCAGDPEAPPACNCADECGG